MTPLTSSVPRLAVDSVSIRAAGRTLVEDVSLAVPVGGCVALVGRNGSGKTTVLRATVGLAALSGGELRLDGRPYAAGRPPEGVAGLVGDPSPLSWMSPRSFGRMVLDSRGRPGGRRHVEAALDEVGLEPGCRRRRFSRLSQGQTALALVASVLLLDPVLIVLDEPFANLDEDNARHLRSALRVRACGGAAVLYTGHHPEDLTLADTIVRMEAGRLTHETPASTPSTGAGPR